MATDNDDEPQQSAVQRVRNAGQRERRGPRRYKRLVAISLLMLIFIYVGYLTVNYSIIYGRDIYYPQSVLSQFDDEIRERQKSGNLSAQTDPVCEPSRTVSMQVHLIEMMTEENAWVSSRPLYKVGLFGVVDFEDTPWFDDKASEQIGMLDVSRRLAIEMIDSLGRVRGTSAQNEKLAAAQASLRIDERAWYLNSPFAENINTISPSAAESYKSAADLYEDYNRQLTDCEAVFDARADNLRETLSRFTATLGDTIVELGKRSASLSYDPDAERFKHGEGNAWAILDMHADNYFHRARGKVYALHGIMQGLRADFHHVIVDRNLVEVWDKMESSIAEAALLHPLMVSNGAKDGFIFRDHLGIMAEFLLRARTSMVQLRDILKT